MDFLKSGATCFLREAENENRRTPFDLFSAKVMDPEEVKKVANTLWSDETIIDEYLKEREELPEEHKGIIRSWKRRIQGEFLMERHLKKGTILISLT